MTAQNLRRHNDPYKLFQESYPYAVARAVRKFRHSLSLAEKHEAAIQCAESLILSLGIMALALAADRGRQDLSAIAQWSQSVERGGVSLGHWVGAVKAVAEDARQHGDPAAGLAEATARKKGGKGLVADLDQLVGLRNKIRHGAGPRTRAELEKSLGRIEPLMLSTERLFGGPNYGSDWIPARERDRRVACSTVLDFSLHRRLPAGRAPAAGIDQAVACFGDESALDEALGQVPDALLDDTLKRLVPHCRDVPEESVLPTAVALMRQLPRVRLGSTGMYSLGGNGRC